MDTFVIKLQREGGERHFATLRIPLSLLSRAHIDPWSEVTIRVEGLRVVIEAVQGDIDLMEMHAEEFTARYQAVLRTLGDELCQLTG